ncbi:AAA family ATPase [Aliikangiella sp. IMCC44653]
MYLDYFSLKEKPFSISPDPRFLFMSNRYREALSHLTYGVNEGGGFVLLTGEVGTGKTTVCRCLLQQLPDSTRLAFVLNPKLNSLELLATICDELKIDYPDNCQSLKILTDRLSEYLLLCYQQDLNVVVMIDEAQNLQTEVLEQIRLLTNLETNQEKLLQIILVGQPELQEKLAQRDLRQLAQRITARYHLRPLQLKETVAYILHRTRIAGSSKALFSRQAIEYLHLKTQGIPRLINTICDRALYAAAARHQDRVGKSVMVEAVKEVMGEPLSREVLTEPKNLSALLKPSLIAAGVVVLVLLAFWFGQSKQQLVVADTQASSSQSQQSNTPVNSKLKQAKLEPINSGVIQYKKVSQEDMLSKILGDQRWDSNGTFSMINLLALWQLDYRPLRDGEACNFAAEYGLRCYQSKGQWQILRELNRPSLLKFSAGLQGEFWGVLKNLNGLEATLLFGERESQMRIEELSAIWTGEFVTLWQAPQGFNEDLKQGDKGEAVTWLSQRLNLILNSQQPITNLFNADLRFLLVEYQAMRELNTDGIAGMQTILKINQETLSGIPLLVTD